jgi:hypothetical protein
MTLQALKSLLGTPEDKSVKKLLQKVVTNGSVNASYKTLMCFV